MTVWITDFVKRVNQLQKLKVDPEFGKGGLWFGGLLYPEAFLTASRQFVAQQNSWSLEELELKYELNLSEDRLKDNKQGFIVTDMSMEGAEYNTNEERIKLSEKLSSPLPTANLKWVHKSQKEAEEEGLGEQIQIPVYLNKQRKALLCSINVPTNGISQVVWYQRGVAIFAWDI